MSDSAVVYSTPGNDALHLWFGLSYASYLVVPRAILQSMPDDWQGRLAALLNEADEIVAGHKCEWPKKGQTITVQLRDELGRFVPDDLARYERGRRRLWME